MTGQLSGATLNHKAMGSMEVLTETFVFKKYLHIYQSRLRASVVFLIIVEQDCHKNVTLKLIKGLTWEKTNRQGSETLVSNY